MYSVPTFDELLNAILTDYRNQGGEVSAETAIRSACLASALWGAYIYQQYISKQAFPDTADSENLVHHGAVQGIDKNAGEDDASYLRRILADIQNPPAGGNQFDYEAWAEEVFGAAKAHVFPLAQGDGTVDVVVVSDSALTGSEVPSNSVRKGSATTVSAGKLEDAAATFDGSDGGLAVSAGDIVRNTFQGTEATVLSIDSPTQLTLSADIFKYVGENYHVHLHTGTVTTVTANKLIDAAAVFNDAMYTIKKGDVVKNLTDGTEAKVVAVDSPLQLTLDANIFGALGKAYVVESLIARVKENIDANRPVTASKTSVLPPSTLSQDVTMIVTGLSVDKAKLADDITALLNSYIPNQVLYLSQLTALAIERGADDATVTVPPVFPVTPATYQMIRAGAIAIS